MKAIDLTKILKPYKAGWVAVDKKTYKVVAHAKNFPGISEKIKKTRDKNILLIPASSISFKGKKLIVFTAANGTPLETFKETVTLYAGGRKYECPFYFSDQLPHETPIILGQLGFFDHFKITFDAKNREIEIV